MNEDEIIITGVNGFVGEHVARDLSTTGFKLHGIARKEFAIDKVSDLLDRYSPVDILDTKAVSKIDLSQTKAIIHLAGLASVGESFEQPERYMRDNGIMVNNLLSSALSQNFKGRIVIVSTGALYDPEQTLPFSENTPVKQSSPYVVGKLFAEDITKYYRTRGLDVIIARPFNHIGPGQGTGFLVADLYGELLDAKKSGSHSITVGNLLTFRDYSDVRDIAHAYRLLATTESLSYTTYNIASGKSISGEEILNSLKKVTDSNEIETIIDQSRARPNDILNIIGDATRIKQELNWSPKITIDQTIQDFVDSYKN